MMHLATVSSKNQITLPVAMLGMMGVKSGDKLFLRMDSRKRFVAQKSKGDDIVDQLAGSLNKFVKPELRNVSWEEVMRVTKIKMSAKWAKDADSSN